MRRSTSKSWKNRRGVIAVLSAVLFIVMLGMVAFAVDLGYIAMVKTQLQAAADSAALAAAGSSTLTQTGMALVAQAFAQYHRVAGRQVVMNTNDVQFGTWDTTAETFTPLSAGQMGTAVKVTVRVDDNDGGSAGLFFGKVFGVNSATSLASAVAMFNPRDICFVIDCSGSMNDDTTPGSSIANTTLIQGVYNDFGFGTYPGTSQSPGAPLGVSSITSLASTSSSPLLYSKISTTKTKYNYTVPSQYLIYVKNDGSGKTADTSTTATAKAYSWVIDEQLGGTSKQAAAPGIMKAAIPALNSTNSNDYAYWESYISNNSSSLGYKSYVTFMMDYGRDQQVVTGTSPQYSIMSVLNPNYHQHSEATDGGTFQFPTPEMPTHAIRLAIIDALQIISTRNATIADPNQQDWVSIVTFDQKNTGTDTTHVQVLKALTSNYTDVMNACTTLQACSDNDGSSTDSEGGLICAYNHLTTAGRANANKVVIFLTDGNANLYESSTTTINNYMTAHPGGWGSGYAQNGALMQSSIMQGGNWYLYALGVGGACNQTFMNEMATKGGTAINGSTYPFATDASTYETTLKGIFNEIISNPRLRLVQ